MTKLVGIYGYARSGKDTIGEHLTKNFKYRRYAFADPLKEAASIAFGIPLDHFYNPEYKETINEFWGFSPRYIAQVFGTECMRQQFRDDFWIKRAEGSWLACQNENTHVGMVVTDVRFDNELKWIKSEGGILIKITRPGVEGVVGVHASEQFFDDDLFDHVIANDDTIKSLHHQVDVLMKTI